jgi:hypothetical protein
MWMAARFTAAMSKCLKMIVIVWDDGSAAFRRICFRLCCRLSTRNAQPSFSTNECTHIITDYSSSEKQTIDVEEFNSGGWHRENLPQIILSLENKKEDNKNIKLMHPSG